MSENQMSATPYFVKPGYLVADRSAMLMRCVLGNGAAVTLYDRKNRFGGMHHFVFPETSRPEDATAQFGNVGLMAFIRLMREMGARLETMVAQILGGSYLDDWPDGDLGRRNISMARKILGRYKIAVISEDVGGRLGRKVVYHSATNQTGIIRVENLRRSDWFKPGMDLRYDKIGR